MFSQFLTPPYVPFAIAAVVMIGIGLIEAIGLGFGQLDLSAETDIDGHADVHGGFLDWLGLGGELPILIWLTSLLGCFTISGIVIQQGATFFWGSPLSWVPASGGALVAGLLLNTLAANGLVRVMPRFETTAVTADDLLSRRGTVLEGTARRGAPARAKVVDHFGQAHFVMIEPHDDTESIAAGQIALLVRREGKLFFGVPNENTLLQSI